MIVLCVILVILSLCPLLLNLYAEFGTWTLPKDVRSNYDKDSKACFGCGILFGIFALCNALATNMEIISLAAILFMIASLIFDFVSGMIYIESVLNSLGHGTNSQTQVPNVSMKQILNILGKLIKAV